MFQYDSLYREYTWIVTIISYLPTYIFFSFQQVTDLNDHLHSKNTIISELKHQIDSYEREIERSNNKTRLIQMRQSIGKQRN
jgi:cell division protein FtsL